MSITIRSSRMLLASASAIAFCLSGAPAWASAQEDAADVSDKPMEKVERKLSGRGYEVVGAGSQRDSQLWWNRSQDRCLELHLHGDRVKQAEVRDEKQCRSANKDAGSQQGAAGAGHAQHRGTSDLIGMRASSLDSEMTGRGFRNVGGHKDDEVSYTTWWNKSMRECLSVGTRDGRVETVSSIAEGKCL